MNTSVINQIKVEPVITKKNHSKRTVRGYDWFPEPYSNTCLLARKMSGKSTVIYRALEECATKGTNVWIFSPTVDVDATYDKMKKMLKKKKCNVICKTHFIENGVDLLHQLLGILSKDDDKDPEAEPKAPTLLFNDNRSFRGIPMQGGSVQIVKRKKKKPKKKTKPGLLTPEHILVFDDLSSYMRHKSVSRLLTRNRHNKLKVFLSCHSVNNLEPMGLAQIDVFCVFPNISEDKIKELAEKVNITFKSDNKKNSCLQKMYDFATERPYNFLYINRNDGTYRKNFNELIDCSHFD